MDVRGSAADNIPHAVGFALGFVIMGYDQRNNSYFQMVPDSPDNKLKRQNSRFRLFKSEAEEKAAKLDDELMTAFNASRIREAGPEFKAEHIYSSKKIPGNEHLYVYAFKMEFDEETAKKMQCTHGVYFLFSKSDLPPKEHEADVDPKAYLLVNAFYLHTQGEKIGKSLMDLLKDPLRYSNQFIVKDEKIERLKKLIRDLKQDLQENIRVLNERHDLLVALEEKTEKIDKSAEAFRLSAAKLNEPKGCSDCAGKTVDGAADVVVSVGGTVFAVGSKAVGAVSTVADVGITVAGGVADGVGAVADGVTSVFRKIF